MANAKCIVNLDKIQAIYGGNIVNIKHTAALENGACIVLDALDTTDKDVWTIKTPATATLATDTFLLHATPEVLYESGKQIGDFELAAGKVGRAYYLTVGDEFTITDDGITGTTVVGQYIIPANGVFTFAAAADLTGNTKLACQVIEKKTLGFDGNAATRVKVVKC
jgi:hypothetical protein